MGQRHQIFVKIANPLHSLPSLSEAQKKNLVKEFGKGEYAILGYHNQWLYARSALDHCLRLLNFSKQFSRKLKTDKDCWGGYNSPICPAAFRNTFTSVNDIATAIGYVMNFNPVTTEWLDAGFNSSFYEKGQTNHDFTIGDNNDGIHIVDMVESKYCFMNIYESTPNENGTLHYSASDLPYLTPVDAHTYVKAYRGESLETTNPYYLEKVEEKLKDYTGEDKQAKIDAGKNFIVSHNTKLNLKQSKKFKGFGLLTIDELRVMFPKMKELKTGKKVDMKMDMLITK
jgi:hypothetical protein